MARSGLGAVVLSGGGCTAESTDRKLGLSLRPTGLSLGRHLVLPLIHAALVVVFTAFTGKFRRQIVVCGCSGLGDHKRRDTRVSLELNERKTHSAQGSVPRFAQSSSRVGSSAGYALLVA